MGEQPNFNSIPENVRTAVYIAMAVALLIATVVYALYLRNLNDLMKEVKPENQKMNPNAVWLFLLFLALNVGASLPQFFITNPTLNTVMTIAQYAVSLASLVLMLFVVNKIADSLVAEYHDRGWDAAAKPTYAVGMFLVISNTASLLNGISVAFIPTIGKIAAFASVVAWIMYWVVTAEQKKRLRSMPQSNHDDSIFGNI
ncbi:MAG: hypothetical protein QM642_09495 [Edaphocola sp.]